MKHHKLFRAALLVSIQERRELFPELTDDDVRRALKTIIDEIAKAVRERELKRRYDAIDLDSLKLRPRQPIDEAAIRARTAESLRRMAEIRSSQWVFPGKLDGQPLHDNALITTLRRLDPTITTHGFRSAFRTWCYEQTKVRDEIAEAALAHTVGNEVRRASLRGDALEERRGLMNLWAVHCEPQRDNVVPIGAKPIPA
jgi:integrase